MPKKKYLWCKKCKAFPNEIKELSSAVTKRKWNDEDGDYMGEDIIFDDETNLCCGVCESLLVEKDEDTNANASILQPQDQEGNTS